MKYALIRDNQSEHRVSFMCRVLQVSRSGYYAWRDRPESRRNRENRSLLVHIKAIHQQSDRTYGSPRITDELNGRGIRCNEKRVARLMRCEGIRPKTARKFRVTTDSGHNHPVSPNVINREFNATRPNQIWLSDITYVWTAEGWLYLAAVLDLHSRRIVGHAMSHRINSVLTETALCQAILRRRPERGLIHHSDRGVQYASGDYQKLLSSNGMIGSMSRKGDCWDNAPMESFFGTLKRELIHHERFATRTEAKQRIFDYIEVFYNGWRRHSSNGSVSPIDFERNYQYYKQKILTIAS